MSPLLVLLIALARLLIGPFAAVPPVEATPPPPMTWAAEGVEGVASWRPSFAADGWRVLLVRPEGVYQLGTRGPTAEGEELTQTLRSENGRFFDLRLCAQWVDEEAGDEAERCWDYDPAVKARVYLPAVERP